MALSVENITKEYDSAILKDFSFTFPDAGVVCLLGKSGCGKTTLINCISGILNQDRGEIKGMEGKKISFVFQEDRLLPWMSAKRNILAVNEDEAVCDDVLAKMGLSEHADKLPDELSGGMRQRVSIARAIAYGGDVFFLDEPFKGIDIKTKLAIMKDVREFIKGKLCIFITHDLEEAKMLSDTIIILDGPPLEIKKIVPAESVDAEELGRIINGTA